MEERKSYEGPRGWRKGRVRKVQGDGGKEELGRSKGWRKEELGRKGMEEAVCNKTAIYVCLSCSFTIMKRALLMSHTEMWPCFVPTATRSMLDTVEMQTA